MSRFAPLQRRVAAPSSTPVRPTAVARARSGERAAEAPGSFASLERAAHGGHRLADVPVSRPGAGRPLPDRVRAKMEGAFGHGFANVRVHEDASAESIGATAYTRGRDVHFAPGRYRPDTAAGQALLGHELTHVVQQHASKVAAPQGKGVPINADPRLEAEADAQGARAARGEPATVHGGGGGVQLKTEGGVLQCMDKKDQKKGGGQLVRQPDYIAMGEKEATAAQKQKKGASGAKPKPASQPSGLNADQKNRGMNFGRKQAGMQSNVMPHNTKGTGGGQSNQNAHENRSGAEANRLAQKKMWDAQRKGNAQALRAAGGRNGKKPK